MKGVKFLHEEIIANIDEKKDILGSIQVIDYDKQTDNNYYYLFYLYSNSNYTFFRTICELYQYHFNSHRTMERCYIDEEDMDIIMDGVYLLNKEMTNEEFNKWFNFVK